MNPYKQTDDNEIGRRIARHAAIYCAHYNQFAAADTIAHKWGHPFWGTFVQGCPTPTCWHNA